MHWFANDLVRGIGTHLLGRRMYETMAAWETEPALAEESPVMADFAAAWQDSDKVVYSTTLTAPTTRRTRLERHFDAIAVRSLKESATADLVIGGPTLAAEAFKAGLVDECRLLLVPYVTGGGKPALPAGVRLALLEQRGFGNGTVYLRYRTLDQKEPS